MNCEKIHQLFVKLQNALVNERCDENSTNVHAHTRREKGNIRVSRTRGGGGEQTEEAPPEEGASLHRVAQETDPARIATRRLTSATVTP